MKHRLLTSRKVEALTERGYYGDGAGLYLQVSAYGTKSWIFRYQQGGHVFDMGLGSCSNLTLAQARKVVAVFREQIALGINPKNQRDARKEQEREEYLQRKREKRERVTFKEAARKFLKLHEATWDNETHRRQWASTLEAYAFPRLGHLPVLAIVGEDINAALSPIWLTKQETAKRVRGRITRVLQWWRDGQPLPQKSVSQRTKHHKAIPFAELPSFMAKLRERDSISARALELTILTALRTSEVIGANWDEINFAAKTWTVPASRMKLRKAHIVPLSERAVEILTSLPRLGALIFPGANGGSLSNMAMLELLRGMEGNGYTTHGMRSSFRDWCGDHTSFPHEVVEFALAHGIPDKSQAAYRRYTAIGKRAVLMEAWASFLGSPAASADVLQMKRRKA